MGTKYEIHLRSQYRQSRRQCNWPDYLYYKHQRWCMVVPALQGEGGELGDCGII